MQIKELPHNHGHVSDELQIEILNTTAFSVISDLFKMMSDEKRVQIFLLLCHCEECVINISALLDMSSPAVSHHLKLLKTAGLVISRREGKEVYYTAANTSRSQSLHKLIEEMIEVNCPSDKTFNESDNYDSQVQIVNEIQRSLTKNLRNRCTIEELAVNFHINQTTLKSTFKRVFGKPIATYMKEYRIKKGMELLMKTNCSIAEIAGLVGYENQSKFTQAFKNVTGILPSEYRKSIK
ncbi:MAG: metalloregulator ArsR/SmtB family transcription factor [Clostridia bacterium]|nr:metalloregulator ArsR/SmtB family transcription factor [Clostridia bacterium]MBQ8766689.1 metalloregulator ArsR/SmtB family transcription factor [Clostridia bacterium]